MTHRRPEANRPPVHIHYHRPPCHTQVFRQELVHDDGRVKVTFAREMSLDRTITIGGEVALEDGSDVVWFTFPGAWHDIGRFHRADGTLTGIYANVLTPCAFAPGGLWHTTDLFLDVWIPGSHPAGPQAPGSAARILDEDELAEAETAGWVSSALADRARKEARSLVDAARAGSWPPPVVHAWDRARIRREERAPTP